MIRHVVILALLVALPACHGSRSGGAPPAEVFDPAAWVDPLIGTEGDGNAIPGPMVPHGMVKLSPDTADGFGTIEGYEYATPRIEGFSHTHLEGPGGSLNGYSQVLVTAVVGEPGYTEEAYASAYDHGDEVAEPGYYAVTLTDPGVRAELTATARAGFHRYAFPETDDARILIDVSHSRGLARDGWVEVVGDHEIRGFGLYQVHPLVAVAAARAGDPGTTADRPVYFHAIFDHPFTSFGVWRGGAPDDGADRAEGIDIGAYARFATAAGERVMVKVGISSIDADQARENVEREIPGWDFDGAREDARAAWNALLRRVRATGGTDADRTRFYTALYHALMQPADYSEHGRYWSGADGFGRVYDEDPAWRYHSDDWCLWDTFRTTHPLQMLVEPERGRSIVESYLHVYEQGGWLPKCTWQATGYSRVMIGVHQACLFLDSWRKGARGFDTTLAWEAVTKAANETNRTILDGILCGYLDLGTQPEYRALGYVPLECDLDQAASMTLEHAYDDGCMAELAGEWGHEAEAATYRARSENWRSVWDPAVGFMRPKLRSGAWWPFFDPSDGTGFTEADAWIYSWFVPQNIPGLIEAMGGPAAFVAKLDRFFDEDHFDPTNEPAFHAPYLYVWAGEPARTQARVREILDAAFTVEPGGLPGNDDAGAMSAWFLFGAMGFYPVTPGSGVYTLASPLFERIELDVPGGTFTIEAPGSSAENLYVQSATLDGATLDRAWITHEELARGGTLTLTMGPEPTNWGAARPPR
ncbi:MAG: GH92 family glycosyl hydrolase [Myxococcales bacterium]|nr:GH92 family glycosyl hydrolase [Myxococcales bacterium]